MSAWSRAARVLAVRLDGAGDVLMTTPALRALREGAPRRRIVLLASEAGAAAAARVPEVDDVIVWRAPWMKPPADAPAAEERAVLARLERGRFDAAAIFTVYTQSPLPAALVCRWAGIPLRLAHCRENPYGLLTDWVRETEPAAGVRHEVRRQLDLVARAGCRTRDERLSLSPTAADARGAERRLAEAGLGGGARWFLMHPGASAPSRRWPPAAFAEAATRLSRRLGMKAVFSGSREEAPLVDAIRGAMRVPAVSLAGLLSFGELAAAIARAALLVSNNTAPAHVAAAVGTPVVDLYALTNPQHTPWGARARVLYHDVPCRFCYKSVCPEGHQNCLRLVTPARVVDAACALLKEANA